MKKGKGGTEPKVALQLYVTGWTPQFLDAYFRNANNFSHDEWERFNKERKELMASIMLPHDLQKEEERAKKMTGSPQGIAETGKERRRKGPGLRRNWLPMR